MAVVDVGQIPLTMDPDTLSTNWTKYTAPAQARSVTLEATGDVWVCTANAETLPVDGEATTASSKFPLAANTPLTLFIGEDGVYYVAAQTATPTLYRTYDLDQRV